MPTLQDLVLNSPTTVISSIASSSFSVSVIFYLVLVDVLLNEIFFLIHVSILYFALLYFVSAPEFNPPQSP